MKKPFNLHIDLEKQPQTDKINRARESKKTRGQKNKKYDGINLQNSAAQRCGTTLCCSPPSPETPPMG